MTRGIGALTLHVSGVFMWLYASAAVAMLSLTFAAGAATHTLRINAVDLACRMDLGSCAWPSADGGIARYALQDSGSCPLVFNDPLPLGSLVTQIDLRVAFLNTGSPDRGTAYFALNLDFFNSTDRYIGNALPPATEPRSTCFPPPHAGFDWRAIIGPTVPDGLTWYRSGMQNAVYFWGVPSGGDPTISHDDPPRVWVEAAEITLHYEPPPKIEFDITDATPAEDRKILIRRWRDEVDYRYPSRFQRDLPGSGNADRDRNIGITGTVRDASGRRLANRRVHLRVVDPPDDAPYVPLAGRVPGDNGAFLGGTLRDASVVSDVDGRFSTVLNGSEVAGDNYQIEASTVADFRFSSNCLSANGCYRSGIITNWERVYLEYDRMFRVGAMIRTAAAAGQNQVEITPHRREFHRNRRISLIHAPSAGEPLTNYYMEEAVIEDTVRNRATDSMTLILSGNLQNNYYPDPSNSELSDGVGLITGNDSDDFFNLRNDYFPPLYTAAFVEYRLLESHDNPVPFVPWVAPVTQIEALADHWFANRVAPVAGPPSAASNHQHLLAGSEMIDETKEGLTSVISGTNYSWVWVNRVEGMGGANNAEWRKLGEHTAHELGHQWHTNRHRTATLGSEHCDPFSQYSARERFCTMHSSADESQFWDGQVEFHYVVTTAGDVDSEYVFIRQRTEPIPQRP